MIKNVNSGLYIDIDGAKAANSTNAQQWGATEPGIQNTFRLFEAGDGYYYIASAVGDGGTFVLDVSGKSSADGANIGIYQYNGGDNQKFKFTKNADGSYTVSAALFAELRNIFVEDYDNFSISIDGAYTEGDILYNYQYVVGAYNVIGEELPSLGGAMAEKMEFYWYYWFMTE